MNRYLVDNLCFFSKVFLVLSRYVNRFDFSPKNLTRIIANPLGELNDEVVICVFAGKITVYRYKELVTDADRVFQKRRIHGNRIRSRFDHNRCFAGRNLCLCVVHFHHFRIKSGHSNVLSGFQAFLVFTT